MNSNGVSSYAVYGESLMKIKNGRGDYRDEVIVELWDRAKEYQAQRDAARFDLKGRDRKIMDLTYHIDILESREEPNVILPNLSAYLKGITTADELLVD